MKYESLYKPAMVSFVLLFLMPLIAALLASIFADDRQYTGLMTLVMGVYNLPFLVAAAVSLVLGNILEGKNARSAYIALAASIATSVLGSVVMLAWGFGLLS